MLSRRLRRSGYEVLLAVNGQQAVEKTGASLPDIVLMDLNMPVLDGWEAARQIKADGRTRNIPVIALTAQASAEERRLAYQAGCDEYETKPVELDRLLAKINQLAAARERNTTLDALGTGGPEERSAGAARHEMATPVNQITGFCELLMEEAASSGKRGMVPDLKRIHTSSLALLTAIDELLAERAKTGAALAASVVNHRIRTPLNDIMGFVELVQEQAFEDGADQLLPDLKKIRGAATELLALVQKEFRESF